MKLNKSIIAILILTSLLLSALGAAYYFYTKHQKALNTTNELKTVFIAAKDIKKNKKILDTDIKQVQIAKKYILTTPLHKNEIVGKIAKEVILANETFRAEKLGVKPNNGEADPMKFTKNSYNLKFKHFVNPNYSLNQGDFINIVSVYPKSKRKENMDYKVQYVAKSIKVIGFLENGKSVKETFRFVRKKVKNKQPNDKTVRYENVKVFADELILDIDSQVILDLLEDYNKGKQIWMVKTKEAPKEPSIKSATKSKVITKKTSKKKVYPVKWYTTRKNKYAEQAIIHYADTNMETSSDKVYFETDASKECKKRDKLLLGVAKVIYLRNSPSLKGKVIRKIYRNNIIPYKTKVGNNWYEICDGSYIHTKEANVISYKGALKKLSWKQEQKK